VYIWFFYYAFLRAQHLRTFLILRLTNAGRLRVVAISYQWNTLLSQRDAVCDKKKERKETMKL